MRSWIINDFLQKRAKDFYRSWNFFVCSPIIICQRYFWSIYKINKVLPKRHESAKTQIDSIDSRSQKNSKLPFQLCRSFRKRQFQFRLQRNQWAHKYVNVLNLDETVAIKYIALSSLTCERLKELLDQEIEILTSLNHPNIVKCFEVLKSAHNCYIITELCDGGDL